jgi:hypothetical protein
MYSEHSRSKRQNSSHVLPLYFQLDGAVVLGLHVVAHSAEYKFEQGAKSMFKSSLLHIKYH